MIKNESTRKGRTRQEKTTNNNKQQQNIDSSNLLINSQKKEQEGRFHVIKNNSNKFKFQGQLH